jgi:hypothetical protein
MAKRLHQVPYHVLRDIPTGFGRNAVVIDGESSQAYVPGRVALKAGPLASFQPEASRHRPEIARHRVLASSEALQ